MSIEIQFQSLSLLVESRSRLSHRFCQFRGVGSIRWWCCRSCWGMPGLQVGQLMELQWDIEVESFNTKLSTIWLRTSIFVFWTLLYILACTVSMGHLVEVLSADVTQGIYSLALTYKTIFSKWYGCILCKTTNALGTQSQIRLSTLTCFKSGSLYRIIWSSFSKRIKGCHMEEVCCILFKVRELIHSRLLSCSDDTVSLLELVLWCTDAVGGHSSELVGEGVGWWNPRHCGSPFSHIRHYYIPGHSRWLCGVFSESSVLS